VKRTLQAMLAAYKCWISPALPNACRFVPTCSEYAMEAVERHGTLQGSGLAVWRLLRCHPLARGGHDPVPQMFWRKDAALWCGEDFARSRERSITKFH
jgi:uncharacterized protein